MEINSQETLKSIKSGINDLNPGQLEEIMKYCKRKVYLNHMEKRCFNRWKQGKATPLDDNILQKWEHKIELKRIKIERKRKLSDISFRRWCEGKATPLNAKIREKFESRQFKQIILKSYGIDYDNHEFSIHHLFPVQLFPSLKFDINNVVPLTYPIHNPVHTNYSNPELAIDPIMPVIESLEASFMEAK